MQPLILDAVMRNYKEIMSPKSYSFWQGSNFISLVILRTHYIRTKFLNSTCVWYVSLVSAIITCHIRGCRSAWFHKEISIVFFTSKLFKTKSSLIKLAFLLSREHFCDRKRVSKFSFPFTNLARSIVSSSTFSFKETFSRNNFCSFSFEVLSNFKRKHHPI